MIACVQKIARGDGNVTVEKAQRQRSRRSDSDHQYPRRVTSMRWNRASGNNGINRELVQIMPRHAGNSNTWRCLGVTTNGNCHHHHGG